MKAVAASKLPIIAACATTVAGAIALAFWLKKSRNTDSDDDNDDESYNSGIDELELPTHMMRAIHKDQRRKASVQFLAMKKPMYDNIVRMCDFISVSNSFRTVAAHGRLYVQTHYRPVFSSTLNNPSNSASFFM